MQKINNKGITLIALVITIIVLLILAGVTIVTLTGENGLIAKATEAKSKTEEVSKQEQGLVNNMMELYKVNIGDYVSYIPDSNEHVIDKSYSGTELNQEKFATEDLGWRVLSRNNDGTIDLISDVPSSYKIYFNGANGSTYNNGVYILNDICKALYSKGKIVARSVNAEDIQSKMDLKYWDYRNFSRIDPDMKYLDTRTYEGYYPLQWYNEVNAVVEGKSTNGKLKQSDSGELVNGMSTESKQITTTMTYWTYQNSQLEQVEMTRDNFIEDIYYDIFINKGTNYAPYWLATRAISTNEDNAMFAMQCIGAGKIRTAGGVRTTGISSEQGMNIRPVVTIQANEIDTNKGHGTKEEPYQMH